MKNKIYPNFHFWVNKEDGESRLTLFCKIAEGKMISKSTLYNSEEELLEKANVLLNSCQEELNNPTTVVWKLDEK